MTKFYHLDFEQVNAGPTHMILEYDDSSCMVLTGRSATLSLREYRQLQVILETIATDSETVTTKRTQFILMLAFNFWED